MVPVLICATYSAQSEVGTDRERVAVDVRMILYRMIDRVPDYSDWHFGWVTNYSSAYSIAYRVMQNKMRMIVAGEPNVTVFEVAEQYYSEAITRRVILPEQFSGQVQKLAFDNLVVRLRENDRAAVELECARGSAVEICRNQIGLYAQIRERFINLAYLDAVGHQTFRPERSLKLDAGFGFDIERAYRPLLIRSGIFIIRFTELTTILVFFTGLVRGVIGIPNNFFLVSAISLIVIYGVDYTISRVDALLNQKNFEMGLIAEILEQEPILVRYIDDWTGNQIRKYSEYRQSELAIIRQER